MSILLHQEDHDLVEKLDAAIAKRHGVTSQRLHSVARDKEISHARFIAWMILREHYRWYLQKIAKAYKRDHTTVVSGLRAGEKAGLSQEANVIFFRHLKRSYPPYPQA